MLAACGAVPLPPSDEARPVPGVSAATSPGDASPLPPPMVQGKSRWQPVRWSELPGFADDALHEAWNAWLKSCERPGPSFTSLCPEVRRLAIGSPADQREWMMRRLQPYRVEPLQGPADGLLTGYYEPLLEASRTATPRHTVPLFRPPANLAGRRPWYTRQEIDTLPEARAALRGREIAWLSEPLDALVLQIQGSGRVRVTEPDTCASRVRRDQ